MGQAQMADAGVAGHNALNLAIVSDPQVARMFIVCLPVLLFSVPADA
jgi:hypothetical protein